jgi:hypothetical protein
LQIAKIAEMMGTKIMRETKLPKISKKKCQVGGDNKYPIGGHK